jgi:hypothetical protein
LVGKEIRVRKDEIERLLEAQIAASRLRRRTPVRPAERHRDDRSSRNSVHEEALLGDLVRSPGPPSRMDTIRQHAEELFEVPLDPAAIAAAIKMRRRRSRRP